MKKILKATLYILLGFLAVNLWFFARMDGFREINHQPLAQCHTVTGNGSVEDIAIDAQQGLAYLSVADRLGLVQKRSIPNGAIVVYNLKHPTVSYQAVAFEQPDDFRPHGISLYQGEDGLRRLFVVNHLSTGEHSIEVFDLDGEKIKHAATIKHPLLVSPNDVVAVGPNQFYVGNDSGARYRWQKGLELLGLLSLSTVVYFDGQSMQVVVDDFPSAGGIEASRDDRYVYVSAVNHQSVEVYRRDVTTGQLQHDQSLPMNMSPDNITVDDDDRLWVAGHPKAVALVQHFVSHGAKDAPSMIQRLERKLDKWAIETIHESKGNDLPASSVAAQYNDRVLVGGITPAKILNCALP